MRWILLIILTAQAATCGQKGPLTLPQSAGTDAAAGHLSVVAKHADQQRAANP